MVLEVRKGGLEVGFEGRWVGAEERDLRDLVEEARTIVLKGGEGLVEVELALVFLFGR